MNEQQQQAVSAILLWAAFADGNKSEEERAQVKDLLADIGVPSIAGALPRVLTGQTNLETEAAHLDTPDLKHLAYEMAVCVCDADGRTSPEESAFLERLRAALALDPAAGRGLEADAIAVTESVEVPEAEGRAPALATMQPAAPTPAVAMPAAALPVATAGTAPLASPGAATTPADMTPTITKYAILAGGLELLPQSLATMAIIPLQIKLVYTIGQRYGYSLDRGHIREFLAILGVGVAAQMVDQFARKLMGGLFKKAGGGMLGGLGKVGTGVAVSFATTYAIGQVANRYYAGGRTIDSAGLKQLYQEQMGQAQSLYPQFAGQIQQQSKGINMQQITGLLRGQ